MKTIGITFAGRRDRMQLLVAYILKALEHGLLSEWHVWNYSRSQMDSDWIGSLPSLHPNICIMTPTTDKKRYGDCYRYYQRSAPACAPEDVFLKFDDDIVYLDLKELQGFLDARRANPSLVILSANVVNNPTCLFLQQTKGHFPGFDADQLWTSGVEATALHQAFLEDPARQGKFQGVLEWHPQGRLNINFIAWLGADMGIVAACEDTESDELNLSCLFPQSLGRPIGVYGPLVVSHLSFYAQDAAMPVGHLIDMYSKACTNDNFFIHE